MKNGLRRREEESAVSDDRTKVNNRRKIDIPRGMPKRIFYAGVGKARYLTTQPSVRTSNYRVFRKVCWLLAATLIALALLSFLPFLRDYLITFRVIFICFGLCFLACGLLFSSAVTEKSPLLLPLCYAVFALAYAMAILLGPVLDRDTLSTTFHVVLLALPLILTDLPFRISIFLVLVSVAFCTASGLCKSQDIFLADTVNCLIYLIASIAVSFYRQSNGFQQLELFMKVEFERDTDGLTRLLNKDVAITRITNHVRAAQPVPSAVVMFDIDNFKHINDTYGHLYGDAVLSAVGKNLLELARVDDILARFGGDEFLLFLPGAENEKDAEAFLHRFLARNDSEEFELPNSSDRITFSFGVSFFPADGTTYDELISKADQALYEAKRSGKNGLAFFR